jgi:hypothetical protein
VAERVGQEGLADADRVDDRHVRVGVEEAQLSRMALSAPTRATPTTMFDLRRSGV